MTSGPFVAPPRSPRSYEDLRRAVEYMTLDLDLTHAGYRFIDVIDFYLLEEHCREQHVSPRRAILKEYIGHGSTKLMLCPPARGELLSRIERVSRRLDSLRAESFDKLASSTEGRAFLAAYQESDEGKTSRERLNSIFKEMLRAYPDAVRDLYFLATFRKLHLDTTRRLLALVQSDRFVSNSEVLRFANLSRFGHDEKSHSSVLDQLNSQRSHRPIANEVDARTYALAVHLNRATAGKKWAGTMVFFRYVTDGLVADVVGGTQGGWSRANIEDQTSLPCGRPLGSVGASFIIGRYQGWTDADQSRKRAFLSVLASRISEYLQYTKRASNLTPQDHTRSMHLRSYIQREGFLDLRTEIGRSAPPLPIGLREADTARDDTDAEAADMFKLLRIGEALADIERRGGNGLTAERSEFAREYGQVMSQLARVLEQRAGSPEDIEYVRKWRETVGRILQPIATPDGLDELVAEVERIRNGWIPSQPELEQLRERALSTIRELPDTYQAQERLDDAVERMIRMKEELKMKDVLEPAIAIRAVLGSVLGSS